jgi:hypothetical protein
MFKGNALDQQHAQEMTRQVHGVPPIIEQPFN